MILQKKGERFDLVIIPFVATQRETEIKKVDVSCSLLCRALILDKLSRPPYTDIIVMISYDWSSKTTS